MHDVTALIGDKSDPRPLLSLLPSHASLVVLWRCHKGGLYEQDCERHRLSLGHRRKDWQGSSPPSNLNFLHQSSTCCAKSSASPGARNTWSTTRETARVTIPTAVSPNLSSCRAPCRGLGINTQLSSRLSTEAIHVGESCTQPRNRTRSCTRSRRNACHITITDANTIGHSTLVVSRIVVSITVS